jgi:hypothetical protein
MRQGLAFLLDKHENFEYTIVMTWQDTGNSSFATSQGYEFFIQYNPESGGFAIDIFDESINDSDEAHIETIIDLTTFNEAKEAAELWLRDMTN